MITTKDSGNVCKILLDLGQIHFSFMGYSIHAPEPTWPGYAPCFQRAQCLFWTCHSKQMFQMEQTAASIGSDSCCSVDSRAAVVRAFLTVRPLFCLPE